MASQAGVRAGGAYVELFVKDSSMVRGLQAAQRRLAAFGTTVSSIGARLVGISAAMAVPFAVSAKTFADFDDQMRAVGAVTGATGEAFDSLTAKARELGRATSYSASEVAGAMLNLGRAGMSPAEINASISGLLSMARATGTDLAEAASFAADTLRGFRLEAGQMGRVADVLTATANGSSQSMADLGESMKYVAPYAAEMRLSLEETSAALGILANNGIKGSMAGTALRQAFISMSDASKRAKLESLGVGVMNAAGGMRSFVAILDDMREQIGSLGDIERTEILNEIFGDRAAGPMSAMIAMNGQMRGFAVDLTKVAGAAKRAADAMDDGLGGSFRILKSALEEVQIAIGEALSRDMKAATDAITDAVSAVGKWVSRNQEAVATMAKIVAVGGAAGAALLAVGGGFAAMGLAAGGIAAIVSAAGTAISAAGAALLALVTPVGIAASVTVAAGAYIAHATGAAAEAVAWLGSAFKTLREDASIAWDAIVQSIKGGNIGNAARVAWLTLKMEWTRGVGSLESVWIEYKTWFLNSMTNTFYGAAMAAANAWAGMQRGWTEVVYGLMDVWTQFSSMVRQGWNTITGELVKLAMQIEAVFTGMDDAALQRRTAVVDRMVIESSRKIDSDRRATLQESDRERKGRLERIEDDRVGTIGELNREAESEIARRGDAYRKAVAAIADEIQTARAEWERAVQEGLKARDLGKDSDKAAQKPAKNAAEQASADALNRLRDIPAEIAAQAEGLRTVGSFSSAALANIGLSDSASERTAKATEQIARNTADTNRKLDGMSLEYA